MTDLAVAATLAPCPAIEHLDASERSPDVASHVSDCRACQILDELLALRRNGRAMCDRIEDLIATREAGLVNSGVQSMIELHVATCEPCRAVARTMISASPGLAGDHTSLPAVAPSAYALGRELARGGMGRILEARDLRVGRPVAVKELLRADSALAVRFEREARVTARLQHPGIVPIYEIGAWPDGTPFYSMRLIEGMTLAAAVANTTTLEQRLALLPSVIAAAEAVAFAHAQQIIHRDLTPANVMVGAYGETVVIDWGLAKDLASDDPEEDVDVGPYRAVPATEGLTAAGAVIGTAAYMPPEQANGAVVDARGDVYAIGALLYHVLAGHAPYRGTDSAAILTSVRTESPRPIEAIAKGAPRDLASIVDKAMARERADRYPTAKELVEELRRFQTGRIVEAHAYSRRELLRRWLRRHRALAIGTLAVAIALGVTGVLWFRAVERERASVIAARDLATSEQAKATVTSARLLEEQGRHYLLANDTDRALAYFDAAIAQGVDTPALRMMLGQALLPTTNALPPLLCPQGQASAVGRTVASRDGQLIAGRCGPQLVVWRDDGSVAFQRPIGPVEPVRFSYDSRYLFVNADPLVVLDARTGKVMHEIRGENLGGGVAVPQGLLLGRNWGVSLLRLDGDVPRIESIAPPIPKPSRLMLFGSRFILANANRIEVWDISPPKRTFATDVPGLGNDRVILSADGRYVVACRNEKVMIWNTPSAQARVIPTKHLEPGCSFAPESNRFLIVSDERFAQVIDAETGVEKMRFPLGQDAYEPTFADEQRIQFTESRVITVISAATGDVLERVSVTGDHIKPRDVPWIVVARADRFERLSLPSTLPAVKAPPATAFTAVSSDGRRAIARHGDEMTVWDLERGVALVHPALHAFDNPAKQHGAHFSSDGKRVVARGAQNDVYVLDTNGAVVARFPDLPFIIAVGCDATCTRVFASSKEATTVFDVPTATKVASLPIIGGTDRGLSPDGTKLVGLVDITEVGMFDVATKRSLATFEMRTFGWFESLGWTADGRTYVGTQTSHWNVVDTSTGVVRARGTSSRVGVNEEGTVLASLSGSRLEIWDIATGQLRHGQDIAQPIRDKEIVGRPVPNRDGAFVGIPTGDAFVAIRSTSDGSVIRQFGEPSTAVSTIRLASIGVRWVGDDRIVGFGDRVVQWKLAFDRRSMADIRADIAKQTSWRVEDGKLLAKTRAIEGRVTRAGRAVAGATVDVTIPGSEDLFEAITDAEGRYRIDNVPDASLEIRASDTESIAVVQAHGRDEVRLPVPRRCDLDAADIQPSTTTLPGRRTSIAFRNTRASTIGIMWVDDNGVPQPFAPLLPGHTFAFETWHGHRWLIRERDKDLGTVVVDDPCIVTVR